MKFQTSFPAKSDRTFEQELILRLILALGVALGSMFTFPGHLFAKTERLPHVGYISQAIANIRVAPSRDATLLTQAVYGASLPIIGRARDSSGKLWYEVLLWGSLPSWVSSDVFSLTVPGGNEFVPGGGAPPKSNAGAHVPMLLTATGRTSDQAHLRSGPDISTKLVLKHLLSPGTHLHIRAWATDAQNHGWFQVSTPTASGWIYAGFVTLDAQNPAQTTRDGLPLSQQVAGKGMWFTNFLPVHSNIHALVSAAIRAGLTHLYPEVAISNFGLYGTDTLDALLPEAHAHGLKVIAWVYPYLTDLPGDIALTEHVARYVTPSGDRPDGITADIEENVAAEDVKTYGQIVRQDLGPDELMIATTYNPRAWPDYPFREVALSWNVIIPMDYWHSRQRPYNYASVYQYVTDNIAAIRRAVGNPSFPVEELGQTFDIFAYSGVGRSSPTGQEILADIQAAEGSGAIGVSFFEWQTSTADEWATLIATPYVSASLRPESASQQERWPISRPVTGSDAAAGYYSPARQEVKRTGK